MEENEKINPFQKLFFKLFRRWRSMNLPTLKNLIKSIEDEITLQPFADEIKSISEDPDWINPSVVSVLSAYIIEKNENNEKFFSFDEFLKIFNSHNIKDYKSCVERLIKLSTITEEDFLNHMDELKDYGNQIRLSNNELKKSDTMKLIVTLDKPLVASKKTKEERLNDSLGSHNQSLLIMECTAEEVYNNPSVFSLKKITKSKKIVDWLLEHPDCLTSLVISKNNVNNYYYRHIDSTLLEFLDGIETNKTAEKNSIIDKLDKKKVLTAIFRSNVGDYEFSSLFHDKEKELIKTILSNHKYREELELTNDNRYKETYAGIVKLFTELNKIFNNSYYSRAAVDKITKVDKMGVKTSTIVKLAEYFKDYSNIIDFLAGLTTDKYEIRKR